MPIKRIHQFKATWKLISKSNRPNTSIIKTSTVSVFVVLDRERILNTDIIADECIIIAGITKTGFIIVKIVTPDGITTDTSVKIVIPDDITTDTSVKIITPDDITTDTSVNTIPKITTDDTTTDASILVMGDVTTNAAKYTHCTNSSRINKEIALRLKMRSFLSKAVLSANGELS
ncbi:MAG: hypothetical protein KME38_18780 [Spirirestis rafaelensis WJT71-NPBG6]|nr:hypothetical protein [Spirirestis rafaelensis WJT71-NPBG6]